MLNSLSGWDLTGSDIRLISGDDFLSRNLFPVVISPFPLCFSRVRLLAFLVGRPHGLLIHKNGRLSIEHTLDGGLCDKLNLFSSCQERRLWLPYFESRLPVTILVAIAARDSGCQEVHRKWENHHGIQRIVTRLVIIQI